MAEFDLVERISRVGPDLTVVRVEFSPPGDSRVHSNIFRMQLYPTGSAILLDGQGRRVTESGVLVVPDRHGLFPDADPRDPYRRVTYIRNNDAEMATNIEGYIERKLRAAAEGRPYPQHHRSTLNLQIDTGSDDADENSESAGAMNLTQSSPWFADFAYKAHIGLRFTGVSGLSGATIDSATLTFRAFSTDSGNFIGDWYAHDAEAPGTFTTTASNISDTAQRPRTTTTCEGDGTDFGNWTATSDHTFDGPAPGIKGIIQELADSYDPSAIALLHIYTSGNGERRFHAEESADPAPKLDIDFTAPSVGQPTQHRTQGIPTGSGSRDRPGRWN